ncbi:hypothetical protein JKP88DRAFT_247386 [Tribonema minus]|uniref:Uncharacterized protein n=1 Tax=Tribonema minus TaxID=303371 RepID=A0A835YYN5_9STRA|nr:hypothetical protein JKP88DRAFT_247386 [Tribonema minus]
MELSRCRVLLAGVLLSLMALSSALSWPAREKAAASGAEPGLFVATLSLAQYRDAPEGRRAIDVYGVYDACDTQMTECRQDPQCLACMKVYNPDQVVAIPAADASAALTCTAALTALEQNYPPECANSVPGTALRAVHVCILQYAIPGLGPCGAARSSLVATDAPSATPTAAPSAAPTAMPTEG